MTGLGEEVYTAASGADEVAELVAQCREDLTMSKFLRKEHLIARANEDRDKAADKIEALARENERRRDFVDDCRRHPQGNRVDHSCRVDAALAKLEAANV